MGKVKCSSSGWSTILGHLAGPLVGNYALLGKCIVNLSRSCILATGWLSKSALHVSDKGNHASSML